MSFSFGIESLSIPIATLKAFHQCLRDAVNLTDEIEIIDGLLYRFPPPHASPISPYMCLSILLLFFIITLFDDEILNEYHPPLHVSSSS